MRPRNLANVSLNQTKIWLPYYPFPIPFTVTIRTFSTCHFTPCPSLFNLTHLFTLNYCWLIKHNIANDSYNLVNNQAISKLTRNLYIICHINDTTNDKLLWSLKANNIKNCQMVVQSMTHLMTHKK